MSGSGALPASGSSAVVSVGGLSSSTGTGALVDGVADVDGVSPAIRTVVSWLALSGTSTMPDASTGTGALASGNVVVAASGESGSIAVAALAAGSAVAAASGVSGSIGAGGDPNSYRYGPIYLLLGFTVMGTTTCAKGCTNILSQSARDLISSVAGLGNSERRASAMLLSKSSPLMACIIPLTQVGVTSTGIVSTLLNDADTPYDFIFSPPVTDHKRNHIFRCCRG